MFKSCVVNGLLSGLVALAPSQTQLGKLNACLAGLARKSVRGDGTRKSEGRHQGRTNLEVLQMLRTQPASVQLQTRRLKWWQRICSRPQEYELLLLVFFGNADFEEDPVFDDLGFVVGKPHAMLKQLCKDLKELHKYDILCEYETILQEQPCMVVVHSEIRKQFVAADVSVLQAASSTSGSSHCVPPPGFAPLPEPLPMPVDKPHVCNIVDENGNECGAAFETKNALSAHVIFSKKTGHGKSSLASKLTPSNKCLFCHNTYSKRACAVEHVAKTLVAGVCNANTSGRFKQQTQKKTKFACSFEGCDHVAYNIEEAQEHIICAHLPVLPLR